MSTQRMSVAWLICILIINAGCIRTAKTPTSPWKAQCRLFQHSDSIVIDYKDTKRAVADFQRANGQQYSALYVEKTSGSNRGQCIRVRQKAGSLFEVYRYQDDIVDSVQINSPVLSLAFARVPKAHYVPLCNIIIHDGMSSVLLVKTGRVNTYSLSWEPQQWEHMEDSIKAQMSTGRELQYQITKAGR